MINNFDDFDSGRMDDLSFDRNAHINEPAKKDRSDDKPFILLSELRDALIGVIEGADTHPRACYSLNMVKPYCRKTRSTRRRSPRSCKHIDADLFRPINSLFFRYKHTLR